MPRFLTICLNPTIQKTYIYEDYRTGSVNRTSQSSLDISGKGINVTRALHALGEKAVHLTHAGGAFAVFLKNRARVEGLSLKAVSCQAEIRFCVTAIDKKTRRVTEMVEEGFPVDKSTESKIRKEYRSLLPKVGAVILSGAKSKGYSEGLFPEMVRMAREAGAFVLADFRGSDLVRSLPFGPLVIKPNLSEFLETFFPDVDPSSRDESVMALAGEKMIGLATSMMVLSVVTDGGGRVMYTDDTTLKGMFPEPVTPVNTTGCGDAFAAGFASSFLKTKSMDEAVRFAVHCAARSALTLRPGFLSEEPAARS
ncbi:MAG: tagatose-6-phosphate kinase [Spirochaetales bacterium]|nr:tagatose-6-phosphate kinase [Spirochaetales bacterium]